MEKEAVKHHHHPHNNNSGNTTTTTSSTSSSHREKQIIGESLIRAPPSTDFVLKWGSRKRLRCMKIQVKDAAAPVLRTTARVDRRVIRSDANNSNAGGSGNYSSNGHLNLRQRAASPAQRILRDGWLRLERRGAFKRGAKRGAWPTSHV